MGKRSVNILKSILNKVKDMKKEEKEGISKKLNDYVDKLHK